MRLIGNKTRLLGEIQRFLEERGVRGGTLIDVFSGTASVGKHFKRLGFRVLANDHLSMCYTQAVAGIEVRTYPRFDAMRREYGRVLRSRAFQSSLRSRAKAWKPSPTEPRSAARRRRRLEEAVHFLNWHVSGREGLVSRSFCPGGRAGRRYLTDENGRKTDGILEFLRDALSAGYLEHGEFHLLLSSLIDAVDRVANISGTYGAYLKRWQDGATRKLELRAPEILESRLPHRAFQEDANAFVREHSGDVLYIDPPYNRRQYAANYHVLEIMAEHHRVADVSRLESALYGKTGLRPYADLKSLFCVAVDAKGAANGNVHEAMTDLVLSSNVDHVVVSYNEEGLLSREQIGEILTRFSGTRRFDFERGFREVTHRRFRSDRDRESGGARPGRSYRVLAGRRKDEIAEWLFYAKRRLEPARKRGMGARSQPPRQLSLPGIAD